MTSSIRIVSDGTATGTAVYDADGKKMTGITAITIAPLDRHCQLVTAQLTFVKVELDLAGSTKDVLNFKVVA